MLKIFEKTAVPKEPEGIRELLIDTSLFINGSPFLVGGLSNNVFIDSFDRVLDEATTETKEAMYLLWETESWRVVSLISSHLSMAWMRDAALPHSSKRSTGKRGRLHYHEAPGLIHEAKTYLEMRMAWETCLQILVLSKFVVPYYGHDINSSKWDSRAGKRFTPPSSPQVFDLNYYPANWRGLAKPRSFDKDESDMKYFSLMGKKKGGVVSGREDRPVQGLNAPKASGSRSGPLNKPKRGPRVPAATEPRSVPLREREDR
ncbi:hypothetical protein AMTR_s00008p00267170 [Amborella trichopoda]|uniref:Uncharacterized protein n=1 Tax=Amborella trichopoda TaxID=13333 RepID=W1NJX6_AMBTC|nr:hypothetical protein AMTR_s00008p00267170 [Amborella trichopoda]